MTRLNRSTKDGDGEPETSQNIILRRFTDFIYKFDIFI